MSVSSLPNSPARRNSCKRRSASGSCTSSGPISPEEDEDDSAGGCVVAVVLVAASADHRAPLAEADRVRRKWVVPVLVGGDAAADPGVDDAVECLVPISKSRTTCVVTVSRMHFQLLINEIFRLIRSRPCHAPAAPQPLHAFALVSSHLISYLKSTSFRLDGSSLIALVKFNMVGVTPNFVF